MSTVADLLEPSAQERFKAALRTSRELTQYVDILEPETIASMALVGIYPESDRSLAAAILPAGPRVQLEAYRLIERCDSGERITWQLTDQGRRLAEALAQATEQTPTDELETAEQRLQELIQEGNADLDAGM